MNENKPAASGRFPEGYTLVGNGALGRGALELCLQFCPRLIGVDGGADKARRFGYIPDALIGDLDSCTARTRKALPKSAVFHIDDQTRHDFEKALAWVIEQKAPSLPTPFPILCAGFMGARIDHTLAALNALARFHAHNIVLVGQSDIAFLAPPALGLELEKGTRLSLFPLAPVSGHSSGLKYPIEAIRFAPDGQIGTSNEASEPKIELRFDAPAMVIILARSRLNPALIKALNGAARF